jgi:O-succinylbenzoic acid--CoA ligase
VLPPADHPLEWLEHRAAVHAGQPALVGERDSLDYGSLWDGLAQWARIMSAAGLEQGEPVAAVTHSRSRLARAIWLAIYAGFPILTVSPSQTSSGRLMRQCGIRQAIADADVPLPGGVRRLPARQLDNVGEGPVSSPTPLAPGRPQILVPTSGTEGPVRAAMLSGANLAASATATADALALGASVRWLCCLPLTHVAGIMILIRAAAVGGAVHLHERFDVQTARGAIEAAGITHLSLVPPMLHSLLEAGIRPATAQSVLVGGAPVSGHLASRAVEAGWPLMLAYGLTETTAHIALGDRLPANFSLAVQPGTSVDVLATDQRATDDAGWIRIAGPTVMLGYANPSLRPGDGLDASGQIRTNDLGRIDAEGRLRVIGRGDDVLISGGINVHPGEVEDMLAACPGVREVAVTGVPDPVWGARIVALYAGEAAEQSVADWARENVPAEMRPRIIARVDALPRTALGKIERRSLGALVEKVRPPGEGD